MSSESNGSNMFQRLMNPNSGAIKPGNDFSAFLREQSLIPEMSGVMDCASEPPQNDTLVAGKEKRKMTMKLPDGEIGLRFSNPTVNKPGVRLRIYGRLETFLNLGFGFKDDIAMHISPSTNTIFFYRFDWNRFINNQPPKQLKKMIRGKLTAKCESNGKRGDTATIVPTILFSDLRLDEGELEILYRIMQAWKCNEKIGCNIVDPTIFVHHMPTKNANVKGYDPTKKLTVKIPLIGFLVHSANAYYVDRIAGGSKKNTETSTAIEIEEEEEEEVEFNIEI